MHELEYEAQIIYILQSGTPKVSYFGPSCSLFSIQPALAEYKLTFGCGISKKMGPVKQDFWPKATYSKEIIVLCEYNEWQLIKKCHNCTYFQSQFSITTFLILFSFENINVGDYF